MLSYLHVLRVGRSRSALNVRRHNIMRVIVLGLAVLAFSTTCLADLDRAILQEIEAWKKGNPAPARLLKFPDGKIDPPLCGLRVYGEAVEDYIGKIKNVDLLEAILVNPSATEQSSLAAARQIIRLKGPSYLAARLAEQDSATFGWPQLAVLRELLRSPFATVKVARIEFKDIPTPEAEVAIASFRKQLENGIAWDQAYKSVSEAHPDPSSQPYGTLVSYLFDSIVSPSGFDILTYSDAKDLPLQHLSELFHSRPRTAVFRTATAIYLYFATAYSRGAV
jgi:hypothetical protein